MHSPFPFPGESRGPGAAFVLDPGFRRGAQALLTADER
jgi:hypothetical protein